MRSLEEKVAGLFSMRTRRVTDDPRPTLTLALSKREHRF